MFAHLEEMCMKKACAYLEKAQAQKEKLTRQLLPDLDPDLPEWDFAELQEQEGVFFTECPNCKTLTDTHQYLVRESSQDISLKVYSWEAVIKRVPKEAPNVLQFCPGCGTQYCVSLWRFVCV